MLSWLNYILVKNEIFNPNLSECGGVPDSPRSQIIFPDGKISMTLALIARLCFRKTRASFRLSRPDEKQAVVFLRVPKIYTKV